MYTRKERIVPNYRINGKIKPTDKHHIRIPSESFLNKSNLISRQPLEKVEQIEIRKLPDFDSRRSSACSLGNDIDNIYSRAYSHILPQKIVEYSTSPIPIVIPLPQRKNVLMQSILPSKTRLLESQSTMETLDFLEKPRKTLDPLPEVNESLPKRLYPDDPKSSRSKNTDQGDGSPQFLPSDMANCLGMMLARMNNKDTQSHIHIAKIVDSVYGSQIYKAESATNIDAIEINYRIGELETPTSMGDSEVYEFVNENSIDNGYPMFRDKSAGSKSPSIATITESSFGNTSPNGKKTLPTERLGQSINHNFVTVASQKHKFSGENNMTIVPPLKITQNIKIMPGLECKCTHRQKDEDFSSRLKIDFTAKDHYELTYKLSNFQSSANMVKNPARHSGTRSETTITKAIKSGRKVASDKLHRSPIKRPHPHTTDKPGLSLISEGIDSPSDGHSEPSIVRSAVYKSNMGICIDIVATYYESLSTSIRRMLLDHGSHLDLCRQIERKRHILASAAKHNNDHVSQDIDDKSKLHDRQNIFNMAILVLLILFIAVLIFRT